jgi:hypothetical protein
MNSEPDSPSANEVAIAETEGQVELAGRNVLSMLQQTTLLAGGNSRYAVEIAQKLSDQCWAAQKKVADLQAQVTELEAEVQFYRDKSARAELWLGKISSEIQERVLGSTN